MGFKGADSLLKLEGSAGEAEAFSNGLAGDFSVEDI